MDEIFQLLDYLGIQSQSTIQTYARLAQRRHLKKGECLYYGGEDSTNLYFLISGILRGFTVSAGGKEYTECKAPEGAYVTSTVDCTIAASYVYNGRTYTDSMRQTMDQVKYTFNIVPVYPVTGDRLVFRIETNIPNFNAANVIWSPGPAAVTGWVEGGQYVIDRTSLSANISYWLCAIYYYNGLNYTSDISISSGQ